MCNVLMDITQIKIISVNLAWLDVQHVLINRVAQHVIKTKDINYTIIKYKIYVLKEMIAFRHV